MDSIPLIMIFNLKNFSFSKLDTEVKVFNDQMNNSVNLTYELRLFDLNEGSDAYDTFSHFVYSPTLYLMVNEQVPTSVDSFINECNFSILRYGICKAVGCMDRILSLRDAMVCHEI